MDFSAGASFSASASLSAGASASLSAGASFSAGIHLGASTSETNLKIIRYDKPSDHDPSGSAGEYIVDFNPNNFIIRNSINYMSADAPGTGGGDPTFYSIPPIQFSIQFTIDGTGVTKSKIPDSAQKGHVAKSLKHFREVTGSEINGSIHRPNYLAVLWGNMYIECVLTTLNIIYTLFDREGSPLRAKVDCTFMERFLPGEGERKTRFESADLTKYYQVKERDTLPLITKRNYDDSSYYLQIAKANKLKNFRNLTPGSQLVLPPIEESR